MAKMSAAVRTGLIGGLLMVAFEYAAGRIGGNTGLYLHLAKSLVFLGGIFMGIQLTRNRENDGRIDFITGLRKGLAVALLMTTIIAIYMFILYRNTDPLELIRTHIASGGTFTPFQMDQFSNANIFRRVMSQIVLPNIVIGFFISAASAFILRKEK